MEIGNFVWQGTVLRQPSQQVRFSAVYLRPEPFFYFIKSAQGNICPESNSRM